MMNHQDRYDTCRGQALFKHSDISKDGIKIIIASCIYWQKLALCQRKPATANFSLKIVRIINICKWQLSQLVHVRVLPEDSRKESAACRYKVIA